MFVNDFKYRNLLANNNLTLEGGDCFCHSVKQHAAALESPRGFEVPILAMLYSLYTYANAYSARYESPLGQDYLIGEEYTLSIVRGLRGLLNGDCGRLDCGTIDSAILAFMVSAGFDADIIAKL